MLAIDLFLFVLIGLWLDNVMPKQIGQQKSCCFCLSPTYWGCCGLKKRRDVDDDEEARKVSLADRLQLDIPGGEFDFDDDNFEARHLKKGNYEPVSVETAKLELKNKYLMVRNLHKVYPGGLKAVAGLNLKMYAG